MIKYNTKTSTIDFRWAIVAFNIICATFSLGFFETIVFCINWLIIIGGFFLYIIFLFRPSQVRIAVDHSFNFDMKYLKDSWLSWLAFFLTVMSAYLAGWTSVAFGYILLLIFSATIRVIKR